MSSFLVASGCTSRHAWEIDHGIAREQERYVPWLEFQDVFGAAEGRLTRNGAVLIAGNSKVDIVADVENNASAGFPAGTGWFRSLSSPPATHFLRQ